MVSVMGIVSEVFGRCVKEIDVYLEVEYEGRWLCCGWKSLRFIWAGRAAQYWRWRWEMVPGIEFAFKCFWGCVVK